MKLDCTRLKHSGTNSNQRVFPALSSTAPFSGLAGQDLIFTILDTCWHIFQNQSQKYIIAFLYRHTLPEPLSAPHICTIAGAPFARVVNLINAFDPVLNTATYSLYVYASSVNQ